MYAVPPRERPSVGADDRAAIPDSMPKQEPPGEKSLGQTPADVPLDILPVVDLTDEQYGRAQHIAHRRNRSYESIDGGRVCGQQRSEEAHLTGVIGEIAYGIKNENCIDESVYELGDDGYDFREGSICIDVKTTATDMQQPSLVVPVHPEPSADLYFLLHRFDQQSIRIIGFATLATLTERDPVPHPGDDLNFIVPQNELWLPPSLDHAVVED